MRRAEWTTPKAKAGWTATSPAEWQVSGPKYCYEKELQRKPELAGTVTAQFGIEADGKVGSSRACGVDGAVSECIAAVIQTIEFPKPQRSGVLVTYPVTFKPTK